MKSKEEIWHYLATHLTDNKKKLFEQALLFRTRHFTIAAEDTFDERNASALVRTAECLGLQEIYIANNGVSNKYKLSRGIVKGSQKWLDVHIYNETDNNSLACIQTLRQNGYQIVATTPHEQEQLLPDFDIGKKSAFFFGTEQYGLSETAIQEADAFIKIPVYGFTESYNMSVSAAILLYDLLQKLRTSHINWQLSESEKLDLRISWAMKCIAHSESMVKHLMGRK